MKIAAYEAKRSRRSKWRSRQHIVVTRNALIRAFATPNLTRQAVLEMVARCIGDSPVPPSWGRLGVRGTFGKQIERRWARYIKPLHQAGFADENGRWLTPIVQTLHDFEALPGDENVGGDSSSDSKNLPVFVDEYHMLPRQSSDCLRGDVLCQVTSGDYSGWATESRTLEPTSRRGEK